MLAKYLESAYLFSQKQLIKYLFIINKYQVFKYLLILHIKLIYNYRFYSCYIFF